MIQWEFLNVEVRIGDGSFYICMYTYTKATFFNMSLLVFFYYYLFWNAFYCL